MVPVLFYLSGFVAGVGHGVLRTKQITQPRAACGVVAVTLPLTICICICTGSSGFLSAPGFLAGIMVHSIIEDVRHPEDLLQLSPSQRRLYHTIRAFLLLLIATFHYSTYLAWQSTPDFLLVLQLKPIS